MFILKALEGQTLAKMATGFQGFLSASANPFPSAMAPGYETAAPAGDRSGGRQRGDSRYNHFYREHQPSSSWVSIGEVITQPAARERDRQARIRLGLPPIDDWGSQ